MMTRGISVVRLVSAFLLINTLQIISATAPPQDYVNNNIQRTIDLTSPLVRERIIVDVKGPPGKLYYIPIKEDKELGNLAWIDVEQKGKGSIPIKPLEKNEISIQSGGIQYYTFTIQDPKDTYIINMVYAHAVAPFPKVIPQGGTQYLEYRGNIRYLSPYRTESEKTIVKLPSSNILKSTEDSTIKSSGSTITYGPYSNTSPLTTQDLYVHYESNAPILVAKSVTRELEVSHWGGNLAVEENYDLYHEGAKLKGQYSRIDYALTGHRNHLTSSVKSISLELPAGATDPYYRDYIGNVSTSRFRNEKSKSLLELSPRYPLFGGWKYNWNHGYNLPLRNFLKYGQNKNNHHHKGIGDFVLEIDFLKGFSDVVADNVKVKVILPEGAKNIKIHIAFDVDSVIHTITKTYLDTTGRPTIIIEKSFVVDEHTKPLQISYDVPWFAAFQKPLATISAFFGLFILSMIYGRLDLTITKDHNSEMQMFLSTQISQIKSIHDKLMNRYFKSMDDSFESFRSNKNEDQFKYHRNQLELQLKSIRQHLIQMNDRIQLEIKQSSKSNNTSSVSSGMKHDKMNTTPTMMIPNIKEMIHLMDDRFNKWKQAQLDVSNAYISLSTDKTTGDNIRKTIQNSITKYESEKGEIEKKLVNLVSSL